jgi:hypothetical protein
MQTISKYSGQKKISMLWFVASGFVLLIFTLMLFSRNNVDRTSAWQWLISYLSPVLTLMASAFVYTVQHQRKFESKLIDVFFYRLIMFSSVFYLLLILALIVSFPLVERNDVLFHDHLNRNSFPLPFVQGLILVLAGIFFNKG